MIIDRDSFRVHRPTNLQVTTSCTSNIVIALENSLQASRQTCHCLVRYQTGISFQSPDGLDFAVIVHEHIHGDFAQSGHLSITYKCQDYCLLDLSKLSFSLSKVLYLAMLSADRKSSGLYSKNNYMAGKAPMYEPKYLAATEREARGRLRISPKRLA